MSTLKFRNITAAVDDPVETWPFEGILTAVERGSLPDWRRLAAAIRADPWGASHSRSSRPWSCPGPTVPPSS
ncbi:MAG: hypothetical protein ACRDNS_01420 [Trebonia sp.]